MQLLLPFFRSAIDLKKGEFYLKDKKGVKDMNTFSISDFFQHYVTTEKLPGIEVLFKLKHTLSEKIGSNLSAKFIGIKSPVVKKAISEYTENAFVNETTVDAILNSLSNGNTFLVLKKRSFLRNEAKMLINNGTDMPWEIKLDNFDQKETELIYTEKCEPSNYIRIYENGVIEFTYQKEEIG